MKNARNEDFTNAAILDIVNYLCDQAGDSASAVLGLIELQQETSVTEASAVALSCGLENSRTNAEHLLRYIDDVRELLSGTPYPGKQAEKFDAVPCLLETVEMLNLACGAEGRRCVLVAPPERAAMLQDRQTMEQVLGRILDAAMRLSLVGEVTIAIVSGPGENGISLSVMTQAPGLADILAHWLNATPQKISMQGSKNAGLAIAVMAAGLRLQAMGGTAESAGEGGETERLLIYIPSVLGGMGNAAGQHDAGGRALDILVAEDCDESYALSEIMLRNDNLRRVRSGLEAVDTVKRHRFDLVLMDIHMPEMDGYTAIRYIRQWETRTANRRTPIVVLSSDDLETQHRSAAQSGCSGHLRKPLQDSDLEDLLQHLRAVRGT